MIVQHWTLNGMCGVDFLNTPTEDIDRQLRNVLMEAPASDIEGAISQAQAIAYLSGALTVQMKARLDQGWPETPDGITFDGS